MDQTVLPAWLQPFVVPLGVIAAAVITVFGVRASNRSARVNNRETIESAERQQQATLESAERQHAATLETQRQSALDERVWQRRADLYARLSPVVSLGLTGTLTSFEHDGDLDLLDVIYKKLASASKLSEKEYFEFSLIASPKVDKAVSDIYFALAVTTAGVSTAIKMRDISSDGSVDQNLVKHVQGSISSLTRLIARCGAAMSVDLQTTEPGRISTSGSARLDRVLGPQRPPTHASFSAE